MKLKEVVGDVDSDSIKRLQIRKTIEEHLDKELKLNPKGIKVLSLFFIDRVANYRAYDEDGNPQNGKFADWFEEEYVKISKRPKYRTLFEDIRDIDESVKNIHNGYFSTDKKGVVKDSSLSAKGELRGNKDDEDTFSLIMKDKEKLLSFESSLRFIFSHSALKEGWDNPNVFQICTLNETNSVMKKRQEIGRGLRICVNQEGERVQGFEVNTLTIMANESYEDFARGLQEEIEKEEGIKFGVIEEHYFANLVIENENGELGYFGAQNSESIYEYLKDKEYVDKRGKIQDSLRLAIKEDILEVPVEFMHLKYEISMAIKKISGNLNVKDANDKISIKLNKEVFLGEDFKELWERVKYKTTYRVDFDIQELIDICAKRIEEEATVGKIRYLYTKVTNKITKVGVEIDNESLKEQYIDSEIIDYQLPDIITYLQNETKLMRKDIVEILIKSNKLQSFKNNPQKFIDKVVKIIKKSMSIFIVDGIKYQKVGDEFYYAQECFEESELAGYLSSNLLKNREEKSIYDYTIYDSDIEKSFATKFNESDNVKLFTKLPPWFKINTPLGNYNPDWAVLIEKDNLEKLYFVVESKGSDLGLDIKNIEKAKIDCGKAHFKAISEEVEFIQSDKFENFKENF